MDPASESAERWQVALQSAEADQAFETERHGVSGLWFSLESAAQATTDADVEVILELLGRIASMFVRPGDWNQPYGPAIQMDDRRTSVYTDLTAEDLAVLRASVEHVPHVLLRARIYDVLALRSATAERIGFHLKHLDTLIREPVSADSWYGERAAWDRALLVARRLGRPTRSRLLKIEQILRRAMRSSRSGFFPLQVADMIRSHGLARDRSSAIAKHLARIAGAEHENADRFRAYRDGAAAWFAWGGEFEASYVQRILEVQSFIDEADSLASAGPSEAMRSAGLYERALRSVRQVPRAAREQAGMAELPAFLARRIREAGAASLGTMHAFSSPSIDLSTAARDSEKRVKGKSAMDALLAFVTLDRWTSFSDSREDALKLLKEHPLQALFSNVHFASDGRVIHRSSGQGGAPIYGVDPAVWRQMIQSYVWRVSLLSAGALWPAYVQLSNEHHLSLADFHSVVAQAGIVPMDRVVQYSRALQYGYDGDFSSAMQLLVPQIEHLVRHHLTNAAVATSTVSQDGIEAEVGLSALMERADVEEIFGEDLAFEIRALLCGPLGPNLRNEVAHGLITDAGAGGASSLYCWWFAFRLVFVPFWNTLHDPDAFEARQPERPGEEERQPTASGDV